MSRKLPTTLFYTSDILIVCQRYRRTVKYDQLNIGSTILILSKVEECPELSVIFIWVRLKRMTRALAAAMPSYVSVQVGCF